MRILLGVVVGLGLCVLLLAVVSAPYGDAPEPIFVIEHDVVIEAPREVVWSVLSDFSAYPDWNPYATRIEGELAMGEVIDLTITQTNWSSPLRFEPVIARFEDGRTLGWRGQMFFAGIHDTDHYFELEALGPDRTRLHHAEEFRGWLPGRVHGSEERAFTRAAFEAMNEALKRRAEGIR